MSFKSVVFEKGVPVKFWTDLHTVEESALTQLKNTASLPFVFKHVSVMPDVHAGKGATVGSVVATKGALCPCAVGVDVGCGMMAVKTDLRKDDVMAKLAEIRSAIELRVPLGHEGHKAASPGVENWSGWELVKAISYMDRGLLDRARLQMGTLGGGNHFIEISLGEDDSVWIVLHSGSRHLGNAVAQRHIEKARDLMRKMFISLPDPDLAYLAEGTLEFEAYWNDLLILQDYARENREEMMRLTKDAVSSVLGVFHTSSAVNCHHNYASREHHYGENVIVTRKGALSAKKGEMGIIPGSMGARTYVVKGLGDRESFHSCSHGAGRLMSRAEAKRRFTEEDLKIATADVECRKDSGVIDEIPLAYKDIGEVMENQKALVEVVGVLKQVVCVKGN